jgi:hypothetical protein
VPGWPSSGSTGPGEQDRLVKAGKLKPGEALLQLRDADSGKAVRAHGGSVYWNEYCRRSPGEDYRRSDRPLCLVWRNPAGVALQNE